MILSFTAFVLTGEEWPCYAFGRSTGPQRGCPSYARNDTDLEHPRVAWPVIYRSAGPGSNWEKLNARLEGSSWKTFTFFGNGCRDPNRQRRLLVPRFRFALQASPGLVPEEGGWRHRRGGGPGVGSLSGWRFLPDR